MVDSTTDKSETMPAAEGRALAGRLGGIGWALFFVWIGVALLAEFPAAVTLFGIGVITLGVQVVRKSLGLSLEIFWVVVGLLFVLGGAWDVIGSPDLPLLPILLIVAGVVGLFTLLRR